MVTVEETQSFLSLLDVTIDDLLPHSLGEARHVIEDYVESDFELLAA